VQKVTGKDWLVQNHSLHEGTEENPSFYAVVFHEYNINVVKNFLESDSIIAGRIHLNKVTFPCDSDSASHSVPQNSFHIPLDSMPSY
jgi:hypothetical protein